MFEDYCERTVVENAAYDHCQESILVLGDEEDGGKAMQMNENEQQPRL